MGASKHERDKPLVAFHIVFICWAKEANAFGLIRLISQRRQLT
jgi:hypothetical protein